MLFYGNLISDVILWKLLYTELSEPTFNTDSTGGHIYYSATHVEYYLLLLPSNP